MNIIEKICKKNFFIFYFICALFPNLVIGTKAFLKVNDHCKPFAGNLGPSFISDISIVPHISPANITVTLIYMVALLIPSAMLLNFGKINIFFERRNKRKNTFYKAVLTHEVIHFTLFLLVLGSTVLSLGFFIQPFLSILSCLFL